MESNNGGLGASAAIEDEIALVEARIGRLSDRTEFLRAVRDGLRDVKSGDVVSHEDPMAELRAILAR